MSHSSPALTAVEHNRVLRLRKFIRDLTLPAKSADLYFIAIRITMVNFKFIQFGRARIATIRVAPRSRSLPPHHQMGLRINRTPPRGSHRRAHLADVRARAHTHQVRYRRPYRSTKAVPSAWSASDLRLNKSSFAKRPDASTTKFFYRVKFSAANFVAASHEARKPFAIIGLVVFLLSV